MRLMHPILQSPIDFDGKVVSRILLENKLCYFNCTKEILTQSLIDEGEYVLSQKNEILTMSKNVKVIYDFYDLQPNKKELGELLKYLVTKANQELGLELKEVCLDLISKFDILLANENQGVFINEFDFVDLLKLLKIQVRFSDNSLREMLLDYAQFLFEYCEIKLIVICGISEFIDKDEYKQLSDNLRGKNINTLFIESKASDFDCNISTIIIDDDLCLIK